jgi:hypothetical protein
MSNFKIGESVKLTAPNSYAKFTIVAQDENLGNLIEHPDGSRIWRRDDNLEKAPLSSDKDRLVVTFDRDSFCVHFNNKKSHYCDYDEMLSIVARAFADRAGNGNDDIERFLNDQEK